jgi:FkbM family methyltransferase
VGPTGQLICFEPNTELLTALECTIGQLSNATLHAVALSNKNGESPLFVPSDDSLASLADWTISSKFSHDGPSHVVQCAERRLDDLMRNGILSQPDFMKCDVEGAELFVFQGAYDMLNRADAPMILFEANRCACRAFGHEMSAARDCLADMKDAQYSFFQVEQGGGLTPLGKIELEFQNILAVPAQRISEVICAVETGC